MTNTAIRAAATDTGILVATSSATSAQLEDFTSGFCDMLALALHERHGWALRGIGVPGDSARADSWNAADGALDGPPWHIYCLNDDGLPVDVCGVFASEAALRRFYAALNPTLISVDVTAEDIAERLYGDVTEHDLALGRRMAAELAFWRC